MTEKLRLTNEELVAHADRGSQFAAEEYRKQIEENGITASMSRKGNCYDNAFVESFFRTLKIELVYTEKFRTREQASKAIFEYIEVCTTGKEFILRLIIERQSNMHLN